MYANVIKSKLYSTQFLQMFNETIISIRSNSLFTIVVQHHLAMYKTKKPLYSSYC